MLHIKIDRLKVPYQVPKKIPHEVCKEIPYEKCQGVPEKVPQQIPKKVSHQVPLVVFLYIQMRLQKWKMGILYICSAMRKVCEEYPPAAHGYGWKRSGEAGPGEAEAALWANSGAFTAEVQYYNKTNNLNIVLIYSFNVVVSFCWKCWKNLKKCIEKKKKIHLNK